MILVENEAAFKRAAEAGGAGVGGGARARGGAPGAARRDTGLAARPLGAALDGRARRDGDVANMFGNR